MQRTKSSEEVVGGAPAFVGARAPRALRKAKKKNADGRRNNGGPRNNSGRKKGEVGSKTAWIREITFNALAAGVAPLEVMLDNMRFHHEKAASLLAKIVDDHSQLTGPQKLLLFIEHCAARKNAQECAVDAAQFVHARLASVAISAKVDVRPALPVGATVQDSMAAYEQLLRVTAQETGLMLENQP